MRYNSQGFRDVEHSQETLLGKQRIVVLGDSVTLGHGVDFEAMFSRVLQAQLGERYDVVSIAMGGLNTPQEAHFFEQSGLTYHPNLVILNFVLNYCDFFTNFAANKRVMQDVDSTIGMFNISVDPRVKRTLKSSALIYFTKDRIEDLRGRLLGKEEKDYFTKIWGNEKNKERVVSGFDSLKALQVSHGFKVVVLIWPLITNYERYDFGHVHRWCRRRLRNEDLRHLICCRHFLGTLSVNCRCRLRTTFTRTNWGIRSELRHFSSGTGSRAPIHELRVSGSTPLWSKPLGSLSHPCD